MPEDLNISEEPEQEAEFEMPNPYEDISAAYNAILAIDSIDGALIGRVRKIKAIQRMSVDIIYEQLKYIKDCISYQEEEEED